MASFNGGNGVMAAWRPPGRAIYPLRARPTAADAPLVACSFRESICVHAAKGTHPAAVAGALHDAEGALVAFRALGLPPPVLDGALGGSPAYDVYLVPDAPPPATSLDASLRAGDWDRGSAFTVLPPASARSGCAAASDAARAVADAILLGIDAGASEGVLAMASSYLASLAAPCMAVELAAVDDLQRAPERAITSGKLGAASGSLLFPWYLDDTYGAGRPAGIIAALLAISTARTPAGSPWWSSEPDAFDALRATLKDRGKTLGEALLDFAVERAFLGSRSDGAHLSDAAKLGDLGRVRFDWSVPFASLPRRLAVLAPIEPTGSTYTWVDLAGAPAGAEITFVFDWELPVLFRFAIVKVDADGAESGRIVVPGIDGATHVQQTVIGAGGLAGLLVVAVNASGPDAVTPFDPDDAPFEPHALTVTIAP